MIQKESLLAQFNASPTSAAVQVAVSMIDVFRRQFVSVFAMCWDSFWWSISKIILSPRFASTSAAISLIVRSRQVLTAIRVAFRAVRFSSIAGSNAFASQCVNSWSYGFKVNRVNAPRTPAQVVNLKSVWNRADKPLMGHPMPSEGSRFWLKAFTTGFEKGRIGLGHRDLLQVNDGLWVQRFALLRP